MSGTPVDKDALEVQYTQLRPRYQKLEDSLLRDLRDSLREAEVGVLTIESRVKAFDSFWAKVQRKGYVSPLDQVKDLCGLRVICYYTTDVPRARQVIESELDVLESLDKAGLLQPAEFGYLSHHFIVTPTEHMLQTVSYRGLEGLVAEIQVRTLLQHAWAELSHELSYKQKDYVPAQFQRHLYQLQAMLENLDAQFDQLHEKKASYAQQILAGARDAGRFDVSQELNIDTLQAFLDFHLPDRDRDREATQHLLDCLLEHGVTLPHLESSLNTVAGHLADIDTGVYGTTFARKLSQYLIVKAALEITDDEIYAAAPPIAKWTRVIDRWRRELPRLTQT